MSNLKEVLDKIAQLNDVDSVNDPEDQPYKSKYAARELLETVRKQCDNFIESSSQHHQSSESETVNSQSKLNPSTTDQNVSANNSSCEPVSPDAIQLDCDDSASLSQAKLTQCSRVEIFLHYIEGRLGLNYIECEETSSGEEHLQRALKSLVAKHDPSSPIAAYVHMYLLNQIGILQATRRQNEKASKVLHQAEDTYETYKNKHSEAPYFPSDLLTVFKGTWEENEEQSKWRLFESEHTQTLYYLAQVYQKAEDGDKAAHYCTVTLRRQLEMKSYDPVAWALNAATLSQYYVTENDFTLSRHCLASAMKIFEEVGPYEPNDEEGSLYSKSIDIKRCWVKYGLSLMEISWMRLSSEEMRQSLAASGEEKNADFFDLELTAYENWMPSSYLLDFEQARPVFLKIQELVTEAKKLYTLDDFCSDYVELIQDHSRAFKSLCVFELNEDRRSKMHKRRADMLEDIIGELNPQYYLLVWRQLVYEAAEAYSAMIDCKVEIMSQLDQPPTPNMITKLNSLCDKSIHKYLEYIGSLRDHEGKLPDPLPQGDERPALVAWFCVARLYYKMIKSDSQEAIDCMHKTLMYYKQVVEACDKHSHYRELMTAELPVCREMVKLLPVKISKMIAHAEGS